MICMRCRSEGNLSTVMETGGTVTLAHNAIQWDEKGKTMVRDTNIKTTYYSCSKGHQWAMNNDATDGETK